MLQVINDVAERCSDVVQTWLQLLALDVVISHFVENKVILENNITKSSFVKIMFRLERDTVYLRQSKV